MLARCLAVFALCAAAAPALAVEPESVPVTSAKSILGSAVAGANYRVEDRVVSDGLLRVYTLDTRYGRFVVAGDAYLAKRLKELAAVAVLEKESQSKEFADALFAAGSAPVHVAGDLVTDPIGTVGHTLSGIGDLFGKVASGIANPNADPDSLADAALGVSAAKRKIAFDLGVDPYSDFPPLANALERVARASAMGGLVVKVGFAVIPGAAGLVVANVATAGNVAALTRDKTPAQLQDINRGQLAKLGVRKGAIQAFLANKTFTPEDQTAIVHALASMPGVRNAQAFIERAGEAHRRDLAVFLRRRAEMLAAYQSKTGGMTGFVSVHGFPMNTLADGRVIFLAPLDWVAWTKSVSATVTAITEEIRAGQAAGRPVLEVSGEVTPVAMTALKELGWEVHIRSAF
jgi:hypothetical protein